MNTITLVTLACILSIGTASANIVPSLAGSPTLQTSGLFAGDWLWSYQMYLDSQERLDPAMSMDPMACQMFPCNPPGTFFTIYDFQGFAGVANSPAGWTATTSLLGLTPQFATPNPPDNPKILNVTWMYTGPVAHGAFTTTAFNLISLYGSVGQGAFSQQATNDTPTNLNGQMDRGSGPINVPAGVPEPASMMLIGAGLVGLGAIKRQIAKG